MRNEEKALIFYRAITNAYKSEEEQIPVKQIELTGDATDDFLALVNACFILFTRLTNEDCDIIDFTHIVNKLVVQDLIEKAEAKEAQR